MGLAAHVVAFLGPWSWWVLGLVLAAVEVLAPGTFFIWFAVAAVLTGALAMLIVLGWQAQVVVFVVLAAVAALLGRRFYGRAGTDSDGFANDRAARQVGRIAVLDTAIKAGTGHIRLDDTIWRAEGPDLPAGARVRITGYRDGRFQVVAET